MFSTINNYSLDPMFFNSMDSYYYSRPVSYRSYYPKLITQEVLPQSDPETVDILNFFKSQGVAVQNLGGLARGIRFGDLEVGKRVYNHNSSAYYAAGEYYIHQWKPTNDLSGYHPTGTHFITKSYQSLVKELARVLEDQRKTYK